MDPSNHGFDTAFQNCIPHFSVKIAALEGNGSADMFTAIPGGLRSRSWRLGRLTCLLLAISVGTQTFGAEAPTKRNPAELPMVTGITCQAASDEIRVLVRVERNVSYQSELLRNPDRLYVDLQGTRLGSMNRAIELGSCVTKLSRVRIGEHEPGTTRLVLYLTQSIAYVATASQDPPGVTLSLRAVAGEGARPLIAHDAGHTHMRPKANPATRVPLSHRADAAASTSGLNVAHSSEAEVVPDTPPPLGDLLSTIQRADGGDADAQAALGRAHESGELGQNHYEQAIRWYERAAEQGNVYAATRLGDIYANGIGTKRNVEQAIHYYGVAAPQSALARVRLRELTRPDNESVEPVARRMMAPAPPSRAPAVLQPANAMSSSANSDLTQPVSTQIDSGHNSRASDKFGPVLPVTGRAARLEPVPPDLLDLDKLRTLERPPTSLSALAVLNTAAPPSSPTSLPSAGVTPASLRFDPARTPRDPAEAAKWYLDAAEQGSLEAQYTVGKIYFEGKGVPKDPVKAATWLRRAAEQGHAAAQSDFGLLCLKGWGVPKNATEALKWFMRSAQAGDAGGQNNLGAAYIAGSGVKLSCAEGARWLRKAADQGVTEAEYALGTLYANGCGVPRDPGIAVQWFRRAATRGYARAQFVLGQMYLSGQGMPHNYAEARQWLERAGTQGLPEAQIAVARIFRDGLGVPRNGADALGWFRKAAVAGSAEAQYALGEMYVEGKSVAADPVLAYAWFAIAASNGQQRGLKAMNTIAPKMTIDQIAAGQKQAYALAAQFDPSR